MNLTLSAFRACAGGYVGGGHVHPALVDAAREGVAEAKESRLIADGFVARCGSDIDLVLLHEGEPGSPSTRSLVLDVFGRAASAGTRLRQHGNGGIQIDGAELELVPRPSEPVVCLFASGSPRGAWDLYLQRMFADPFNTPRLVTDAQLSQGFRYVTADAEGREDVFDLPGDLYRLLAAVGGGNCIRRVVSRSAPETAAAVSGAANPVLIVRCETLFPGVDDVLEAIALPGAPGKASVVPVSANTDASTRAYPRAIGLGFQVLPDRLVGPRDLLGDGAFDDARRDAARTVQSLRAGAWAAPARTQVPTTA